jgi:hypothetical protein
VVRGQPLSHVASQGFLFQPDVSLDYRQSDEDFLRSENRRYIEEQPHLPAEAGQLSRNKDLDMLFFLYMYISKLILKRTLFKYVVGTRTY